MHPKERGVKSPWTWLKDHVDAITSGAAILGVIVGAVGFWVTWYQLSATTAALKASNTYTIQSDARELLDTLEQRNFVRALIDGKLKAEDEPNARFDLWKMFNFYLSVYRQSKADGITDEFRQSFIRDFCGFLARPPVDMQWKNMAAEKRLSDEQIKMRGDWCGAPS